MLTDFLLRKHLETIPEESTSLCLFFFFNLLFSFLFPKPRFPSARCHRLPQEQSCSQETRSRRAQSTFCAGPDAIGRAGRVHAVRQHLSSGGPGFWDETRPLLLHPQHTTALRPQWGGLKTQHLLCLFIFHGEAPALADTQFSTRRFCQSLHESQHCHKHL